MPIEIKEKDSKLLGFGGVREAGVSGYEFPTFGSDLNDFVEFNVYDMDGTYLNTGITSDFEVKNKEIVLKPGKDLRSLDYRSGKYKVKYYFFRRLGGSDSDVLLDGEGKVYSGKNWVDEDGRTFAGEKAAADRGKELFSKENRYYIDKISSSRTEVRLVPTIINDETYKREFFELAETHRKYTPISAAGWGDIQFDLKDKTKLDADLRNDDAGFTKKMIGGKLVIWDAYVKDGKKLRFESKIIEVIDRDTIRVADSYDDKRTELGIPYEQSGLNELTENQKFSKWKTAYRTKAKKDLTTLLHFDNPNLALAVNWQRDDTTFEEYPHSIVYKLYDPLPAGISEKDYCYVVKEMADPYEDEVVIIPFIDQEVGTLVLRSPNMDVIDSPVGKRETTFQTYDDIVTADDDIREEIENELLSGSFANTALLNVEYDKYENFVNFSSAKQRLQNFKYKLEQIESATSQSTHFGTITGSGVDVSKQNVSKRQMINSFDGYERYLYFESSSFTTGSKHILTLDSSWPKTSGAGTKSSPYMLAATTSSQASVWYDKQIESASLYDIENDGNFMNMLPNHITDDTENEPFLKMMKMTAQHFDNVWMYVKNMDSIHDRRRELNRGYSKDLVYNVGKSLGTTLKTNKDIINLPRYVLGKEITGSDPSVRSVTSEKDISREIWKRIVENNPYFIKTKGTEKALRALINCYGIPSSILRIREYGGPDLQDTQTSKLSYGVTRKFSKAIDFKGSQYVKTLWSDNDQGAYGTSRKPDTVEFRFKTATGSSQILLQSEVRTESSGGLAPSGSTAWVIRLKENDSTDNRGHVSLMFSGSDGVREVSSSQLPVYDGEWWNVMLRREEADDSFNDKPLAADHISQDIRYKLFVKKYDQGFGRINLYGSATESFLGDTDNLDTEGGDNLALEDSFYIMLEAGQTGSIKAASQSYNEAFTANSALYLGGRTGSAFGVNYLTTFGAPFSGSMQEFRLWNSALSESRFDNHVKAAKAYDGNSPSASYTELIMRYSFNEAKNHSTDNEIRDTSANQTFTQTGSAFGFANETNYSSISDKMQMFVPNNGPSRRLGSKIRIESNVLERGQLSVDKRAEVSAFDFAPNDSNKVGLYFSPVDVVNEDIQFSVADLDFNQYIGDPRDLYEYEYRGLSGVRETYWQKYTGPNNFWDYLRLLKFYDFSIFEQLVDLLPARVKPTLGVVIEPNIFERPKVRVFNGPPSSSNEYFSGSISITRETDNETLPDKRYGTQLVMSGSTVNDGLYPYHQGAISQSSFIDPTLYKLGVSHTPYATASVDTGGPNYVFAEAIIPFVSSSRASDFNQSTLYFYTSSGAPSFYSKDSLIYRDRDDKLHLNADSSSYYASEYDTKWEQVKALRNLAFDGCLQTQKTTPDGKSPVEIIIGDATVLTTADGGSSKLKAA